MPDTLSSPLIEAASETFENLAYFFADVAPIEPFPPSDVDGVVAVAFDGPSKGGVILQLSGGILPSLASNMLGLDEPASTSDQRDALGEAANVICGNVLPRVAGTSAVFALTVPTAYASWDAAIDALGAVTAHVRLDLEGGRADIGLVMLPSA